MYRKLGESIIEEVEQDSEEEEKRRAVWDSIWDLKLPSKIKILLWRLSHQIIPTRTQLQTCGMELDTLCFRCTSALESCLHAVWSCPESQKIWSVVAAHLREIFSDVHSEDMVDWLHCNLTQKTVLHNSRFAIILWLIWYERNNVRLGKPSREISTILQSIDGMIRDHVTAPVTNTSETRNGPARQLRTWTHPPQSWYKMNSDAAVNTRTGKVGVGAVIRDNEGRVLAGLAYRREVRMDVLTAEAVAFREGIRLACAKGLARVEGETDSSQLLTTLRSDLSHLSPIGPIVHDIHLLCSCFQEHKFSYTPREANEMAHQCAQFSLTALSPFTSFNFVPQFLNNLHGGAA